MSTTGKVSGVSHLRQLLGPAVLLPWPSGSKGNCRKWKHLQLADMSDEYLAKFERDRNVGVALGKASNGLVTIDFDDKCSADFFFEANPLLTTTLRTRGSRGCNIWIRCAGDYPPSCNLKDA